MNSTFLNDLMAERADIPIFREDHYCSLPRTHVIGQRNSESWIGLKIVGKNVGGIRYEARSCRRSSPTPRLSEPAERPDDRADYRLGWNSLPSEKKIHLLYDAKRMVVE